MVALDAGGKLYPDLQISHASEGDLSDNLPSDIDKVGELHLMNEHIDILLNRRVTDDDMVFLASVITDIIIIAQDDHTRPNAFRTAWAV